MGRIEARLAELGISLPQPMKVPAGVSFSFPAVRIDGERALISGHGALQSDGSVAGPFGKVGAEVTLDDAVQSARLTGLAMLTSLKAALGDLDRVECWVRAFGMVNGAPGFTRQPAVINGFSDLILDVFGPDRGSHARSAIGVADLPFNLPVEIEGEVRIRD